MAQVQNTSCTYNQYFYRLIMVRQEKYQLPYLKNELSFLTQAERSITRDAFTDSFQSSGLASGFYHGMGIDFFDWQQDAELDFSERQRYLIQLQRDMFEMVEANNRLHNMDRHYTYRSDRNIFNFAYGRRNQMLDELQRKQVNAFIKQHQKQLYDLQKLRKIQIQAYTKLQIKKQNVKVDYQMRSVSLSLPIRKYPNTCAQDHTLFFEIRCLKKMKEDEGNPKRQNKYKIKLILQNNLQIKNVLEVRQKLLQIKLNS